MTTDGSLGILPIALIAAFIVIGATASSVIIANQNTAQDTYTQAVTEVTNDLTSYLKVQQIIGKFNQKAALQQIAINIRPLVTGTIDLSQLKIEIITSDDLTLLSYQDTPMLSTGSLFLKTAWDQLTPGSFTMLVTIDDDSSILTAHTLNKNTDAGFLLVSLPTTIPLHQGDTFQLILLPTPGQARQFTLDVPSLTTSPVVLYP